MNKTTNYSQTHWSLADLFPAADGPEMQSAFKTMDEKVAEFEGVRSKLAENLSQADFLAIIRQMEEINSIGYRLYAFANLSFAENTQNQAAQSLLMRVQQYFADLSNRTLFFQPVVEGAE